MKLETYTLPVVLYNDKAPLKGNLMLPQNIKHRYTYNDPVILLLGIYPLRLKTYVDIKTYIQMCI